MSMLMLMALVLDFAVTAHEGQCFSMLLPLFDDLMMMTVVAVLESPLKHSDAESVVVVVVVVVLTAMAKEVHDRLD